MDFSPSYCLLAVLLLVLVSTVRSQFDRTINLGPRISCHQCWTKEEPLCGSWNTLSEPLICGPKENVCKKLITRYYKVIKYGRDVDYELVSNVTSRLCGHADWTGCRTLRGAASTTTECACKGDGCNTAALPLVSMTFTITISTAATVFLRSWH